MDEREYKIILEEANVEPQLQKNYYFGSPFIDREIMVRIRQKAASFTLCYKRRMAQMESVTVCDEYETELSQEEALRMLENGISARELKQFFGVDLDNMRHIGSMDTYRAKFKLEEWTLELDKNVYLDRVDYELECEDRDVAALNKLKNYLYYKFGTIIKPASPKVQRFLDRLAQLP